MRAAMTVCKCIIAQAIEPQSDKNIARGTYAGKLCRSLRRHCAALAPVGPTHSSQPGTEAGRRPSKGRGTRRRDRGTKWDKMGLFRGVARPPSITRRRIASASLRAVAPGVRIPKKYIDKLLVLWDSRLGCPTLQSRRSRN
jgi:hypothetical protein